MTPSTNNPINKTLYGVIILLVAVVIGLILALILQSHHGMPDLDDAAEGHPASTVKTTPHADVSALTLSDDSQRAAGIQTQPLKPAEYQTTVTGFAEVMDVAQLMTDAGHILQLNTDIAKSKIALHQDEQTQVRTRLLNHADHNVSDQSLEAAEGTMQTERANLAGIETDRDNALRALRLNWGSELVRDMDFKQGLISQILSQHMSLWRISLPASATHQSLPQSVTITTPSGPETLSIVGPAPHADDRLQGVSVLAVSHRLYATGLRTSADWPAGTRQSGVIIPANAILWWQGMPWAYRAIKAGPFERVSLQQGVDTPEGRFVTTGWAVGDQVVVQGAQLLLSKEQRPSGPAKEDDDE